VVLEHVRKGLEKNGIEARIEKNTLMANESDSYLQIKKRSFEI
jgi:hypothetical protein